MMTRCSPPSGNGIERHQSNLEAGLAGFDEGAFDHVILSQTLQAMRHTETIVFEMLRVGREAIVTFPNFGYWKHRMDILNGRMPVSGRPALPVVRHAQHPFLPHHADFEVCAKRNLAVKERKVFDRRALRSPRSTISSAASPCIA